MIAALCGAVTSQGEDVLFLDVHGVQFLLHVTPRTNARYTVGQTVTIHTHLHVREDALDLFGFPDQTERQIFERLLTVSGVGPKVALAILGGLETETLAGAIEKGDASILRSVPGVGGKTAERIIVDLRGKLITQADDGGHDEVVGALTRLGYSQKEARDAARLVPADGSLEERLKAALRQLGK